MGPDLWTKERANEGELVVVESRQLGGLSQLCEVELYDEEKHERLVYVSRVKQVRAS